MNLPAHHNGKPAKMMGNSMRRNPTVGPRVRELFVPAELYKEPERYGEDPRIGHLRARLLVLATKATASAQFREKQSA